MSSISRQENRTSIRRNRSRPLPKQRFAQALRNIRPRPASMNLRQAIIDKLQAEQGLRYEKSQILVSCGAKHSLYNLAEALLEAGDEIIIPTPYWVSYADQTLLNDATPVLLPTREEMGTPSMP